MDHTAFLRNVPLFADLSEQDLERICRDVKSIHLAAGETLFQEGNIGKQAYVIRDGKIEIYKTVSGKKIQLAIRQSGEVIGEISLLEETPRSASGKALTDSELIEINAEQIYYLISSNPAAARTMLHTIISRLQSTEASLRQSEKMAQLGTFTAGIAHEIINPSAAVQRGARHLKTVLEEHLAASLEINAALTTSEQIEQFQRLRKQVEERVQQAQGMDPVTRMDREEALETWLDTHGISGSGELDQQLIELDYDEDDLEVVSKQFPGDLLPVVLKWISKEAEVQRLLDEIWHGAGRITDIVKALKSYVYLDQAPNQEIDLHEGIENTLIILRHKLKHGVHVVREYDRSIPPIFAYGSELNQVWTNLIDNAIDAMHGNGQIILRTRNEGEWAAVEVEDNGPGISAEVEEKLFYPFFTTKPVGKGTGLGLNISYRIVQKHGGKIEVESKPGRTRFIVRLPVNEGNQPPSD